MAKRFKFKKWTWMGDHYEDDAHIHRQDDLPPGMAAIDRCSCCGKAFGTTVPADGILILGDDYCDPCYFELCEALDG